MLPHSGIANGTQYPAVGALQSHYYRTRNKKKKTLRELHPRVWGTPYQWLERLWDNACTSKRVYTLIVPSRFARRAALSSHLRVVRKRVPYFPPEGHASKHARAPLDGVPRRVQHHLRSLQFLCHPKGEMKRKREICKHVVSGTHLMGPPLPSTWS